MNPSNVVMAHYNYNRFIENITSFSFAFLLSPCFRWNIACRSCFLQFTIDSQTKKSMDSKPCCQTNCSSQMRAP